MNINLNYDSSTNAAPAGFQTTVAAVASFFQNHFIDPITINITVAFGALASNLLGQSQPGSLNSFSYSNISTNLSADATTADDATAALPSTDPITGTHTYWLDRAEQKALGLLDANNTGSDGTVTFQNAANTFDYNRSDGITAGLYDFAGTVAHEISEIMGRSMLVGGTIGSATNSYDLLDLFHFQSDGGRQFAKAAPSYFSFDNGHTNINTFNVGAGDAADWAGSAGNDAFLNASGSGIINPVTLADARELDVLGWNLVETAPTVAALSGSVGEDGPSFSKDLSSGTSDAEADFLVVQNLDTTVTTAGGRHLTLGTDYTISGSTIALTASGFAKFNSLSQGTTDSVDFGYNVSDFMLSTHGTFTLTVNGANDAPLLGTDAGSPHPLTEQAASTGSSNPDQVSGTLSFFDADENDTHTASASLNSESWNGGVTIPAATLAALATAMSDSIGVDSALGSLGWNFSLADKNVDFLAANETLTATYDITVTDNHSASSTQQVTVVFTGANDTPVIVAGNSVLADATSELPNVTNSSAIDSTSGVVAFSDPDLNDRPTATINAAGQTVTWQDATHNYTSELTPAQISMFEAAVSISAEAGNTNTGKIDWAYNIVDKNLDFLGGGESLTVTTPVVIDDHNGGIVRQNVLVTINGANDDPIAAPDSNGTSKNSTLAVSAPNGLLSNDTDPDAHDQGHLFVGAVGGSPTNVGHAVAGNYGSVNINADGSYVYEANKGSLPSKIVAQDTFIYTVADGHGGTDTSTLSIIVTNPGVNYLAGANTTLNGGNGQNVLDGSAGHDVLIGGNSADVLVGGIGDTLTGGNGPDTFLFRPDFGTNTITDFDFHNDAVQLDKAIFSSVADLLGHTSDTANGAVINDTHGDTITFTNVTLAQLQAHSGDFHIV
jgi:VCBS repeat-containing protein